MLATASSSDVGLRPRHVPTRRAAPRRRGAGGRRRPGLLRRGVPRDRHRPDRHPHRTGHARGPHRLARHREPLGPYRRTHVDPEVDCPLRFPGQYHDDETGLHYNLHRYYNPDTGRLPDSRPAGPGSAPNDHAYVPNPLTHLDPLGLCAETVGDGDGYSGDERYRVGVAQDGVERTLDNSLDKNTYLRDVAQKYGINLRGSGQDIDVVFDPDLAPGLQGVTRAVDGGRVIDIGPAGIVDDTTAANTIAHELGHARYFLRNGSFEGEVHGGIDSMGDGTPYGSATHCKTG